VTSQVPDDASIPDSTVLWRRINPNWWVRDESEAGRRLSSQAFHNSPDGTGTSVMIAHETTEAAVLRGYEDYGLAALPARLPRDLGQAVVRVPLPDMPAHAQIEGHKSHSVKKALAAGCAIVRAPAGRPPQNPA